jgi:hypothetical protein
MLTPKAERTGNVCLILMVLVVAAFCVVTLPWG